MGGSSYNGMSEHTDSTEFMSGYDSGPAGQHSVSGLLHPPEARDLQRLGPYGADSHVHGPDPLRQPVGQGQSGRPNMWQRMKGGLGGGLPNTGG
jgi:hypothetical protein